MAIKKKKVVVDDEIIDNPEEVTIEDVVKVDAKAEYLVLYATLKELGITRISDLENLIAKS